MKRSIGAWEICGFITTSICGTLLHFLYDISGKSHFAAMISGVNESTWEHMKLLFMPMFFFAVFQCFFFNDRSDFWNVKLRGIVLGLVLIPVLFYTYNGVVGISPDFVNIAIFFISALIAFIYETRLFKRDTLKFKEGRVAFYMLLFIAFLFVVFTFKTPHIEIFKDPITGTYGIE